MFGNRVRYEKTAFLAWLKGQGRALTADTGQK
jgi:hypothetical protein